LPHGGITVTSYVDRAESTMRENADGSSHLPRVLLRPKIEIAGGDIAQAHKKCFIANSVNCPLEEQAEVRRVA
jgi:organic hydroperoxide reductase OsmC/OhrA